jgi:anti-sigma factor RsiW
MRRADAPLSCVRVKVLVEAYLDESLGAARRSRVDVHLSGCESCRAELAQALQVRTALRALPWRACSDVVMESVRARLAAADAPAPSRSRKPVAVAVRMPAWTDRLREWFVPGAGVWRPAAGLALAALLMVGVYAFMHRPQERPVTTADMQRAEGQVRWVMARIGQISQHAGNKVRTEVLEQRVADPTARAVSGALENSVRQ